MKYPISPSFLQNCPNEIVKTYQDLEDFILADICRRFKLSGEATESALEQIRLLQRRGLSLDEIEKRIKKTLNLTNQQFDEIYQNAIDRNQQYFDYTITKADIAVDTFTLSEMEQEVEAIRAQTLGEFKNITQSLGFAIRGADGKAEFLPIAKTYQKILDDAEMQVWSGAVDYNTAIRNAVKRLTDSGLQTVDYASGWHNRVDVAARRAVMTGVSQVSAKYSNQLMETLDTPYMEITAHAGARDKPGPNPWSSHKAWQGKVYSTRDNDIYPNVYTVCGWGEVDGLEGVNCRHHHFPWIEGVSERTYTDEQLANIDPPPFEYQGKTYTHYEATQRQRQLEDRMRNCKRRIIAAEASGDTDTATAYRTRLRALSAEYKQFSKAADLRQQPERARVEGFKR